MGKKILIVDDDPWIRQMVGTMLEQGGHDVASAEDGEDGLEKASDFRPELIISDVMMDPMDGWTFVRTLRSHPEFVLTPVIFLTGLHSQKDRLKGFRLGADDYLTKPFNFDELNLRIERTFAALKRIEQRASAVKAHESKTSAISGDLAQLGVNALLTLFDMEKKSGILVIKGEERVGRVFFRKGEVLSAFVEATETEAARAGADAIYSVVRWAKGTFEFSALDVDMDDEVKVPIPHLLLEAARRIDEENDPDLPE